VYNKQVQPEPWLLALITTNAIYRDIFIGFKLLNEFEAKCTALE
jgi:hypothetical protein